MNFSPVARASPAPCTRSPDVLFWSLAPSPLPDSHPLFSPACRSSSPPQRAPQGGRTRLPPPPEQPARTRSLSWTSRSRPPANPPARRRLRPRTASRCLGMHLLLDRERSSRRTGRARTASPGSGGSRSTRSSSTKSRSVPKPPCLLLLSTSVDEQDDLTDACLFR